MSARPCPWCGEPMADTNEEVCSPECAAEAQDAAYWREEEKKSALKAKQQRLDEAARATREDHQ